MSSPSKQTWNAEVEENLKKRQKLSSFFDKNTKPTHLFLLSPSDWGVCRNGGRRGACFAPQAITHAFSALAWNSEDWNQGVPNFLSQNVSSQEKEAEDFDGAQKQECQFIEKQLQKHSQTQKVIHLGGGHDHVSPFLQAIINRAPQAQGLGILNIDAHCDTRTDTISHSGTPFRQTAQYFKERKPKEDFHLVQIGVHPYSNPKENYEELPTGRMTVLSNSSWGEEQRNQLKTILKQEQNKMWVLSLDCDGLDASFMQAVSAVNHTGLNVREVFDIIHTYKDNTLQQKQQFFGIYEYNPLFDDLSSKGSRALAAMIYEFC